MTEETTEQKAAREAAEVDVAGKGKGKDDEGDEVVLRGDQYNALLDRLQELEELALKGGQRGRAKTVDELADELERQPEPRRKAGVDPAAIDNMTNTDLARLILMEVNNTVAQPLLVKLEEMRVKDEIKELRGSLGEDDDFDDLREEIYKVASKNPGLSISQAYKLAKKEENPAKGKKKDEDTEADADDKRKSRDNLLHLPPRVSRGEKPTHARGASDRGNPETRTDAASRAYEDLEKQGLLKA